jgi:hypothetical protein
MVFSFVSLTEEVAAVTDKKIDKFTALVSLPVSALLLILTLMSAYYVAAESIHECHEEDCPVCATLEVCEALLNRIGSALPIICASSIAFITIALNVKTGLPVVTGLSLVEEKIRMNN